KKTTRFHERRLERSKVEYETFSKRLNDLSNEIKKIYNEKRQVTLENEALNEQIKELIREKEEQQQRLEELKVEREKEEQAYQEIVDELKSDLEIEYDYEYKRPSMFSSDKYRTNNVIVSKEKMDELKRRANYGKAISKKYDSLRKDEDYQHLQNQLGEESNKRREMEQKMQVARENYRKYQNRIDRAETKENNTKKIMNKACGYIKGFVGEKAYHVGVNFIDDKMNRDEMIREVVTVDKNDERMFAKKDRREITPEMQLQRSQNKDKGFELDK
ncbi:TPA: hypothetical protein PGC77_002698, partial [Staphylococcus aureus]|nr:hypothetical protein [Staphylococcus aureus]HDG6898104.1 hypothetical protein [Staphylococcus aureus]